MIVGDRAANSTGYLVDAVCPPNPTDTFGTLLTALRRKVRRWRFVFTAYPPCDDQSYGRARYSKMSCFGIIPLQCNRSWFTYHSCKRRSLPCSVGPGSVSLSNWLSACRWYAGIPSLQNRVPDRVSVDSSSRCAPGGSLWCEIPNNRVP